MSLLYLIRHGSTEETGGRFPSSSGRDPDHPGPPLTPRGAEEARSLRAHLRRMDLVWSSHAGRAIDTADHAVRTPDACLPVLAETDFGPWAGRTLAEVHAASPADVEAWMHDADAVPDGAESFTALRGRARDLLAAAADHPGTIAAVTHGGVIRAVLTEVLAGSQRTPWAVDVPPASVTVLRRVTADDLRAGEADMSPVEEPMAWQVLATGWRPTLPGGPHG